MDLFDWFSALGHALWTGRRGLSSNGPLSHPGLRPEIDAQQIVKYSQRITDVLNLKTGRLESIPSKDFKESAAVRRLYLCFSFNREGHLSPPLFKGQGWTGGAGLTFENLLSKTVFSRLMKKF